MKPKPWWRLLYTDGITNETQNDKVHIQFSLTTIWVFITTEDGDEQMLSLYARFGKY